MLLLIENFREKVSDFVRQNLVAFYDELLRRKICRAKADDYYNDGYIWLNGTLGENLTNW